MNGFTAEKLMKRSFLPAFVAIFAFVALLGLATTSHAGEPTPAKAPAKVRQALFVAVDGVYNSELMAPYDVLQHSIFRDPGDYIATAVVSPDGKPFKTFEGLTVHADYSFESAPEADILIIPSAEGSLDKDLEDARLIGWLKKAAERAEWVITVCDGAFPLAKTGALNGRVATTFPADRARLRELFPKVEVRDEYRLVVDGKFITSVGGGMSYEPALWLIERLYGKESADATAKGLVWPWDSATMPLHVVGLPPAQP